MIWLVRLCALMVSCVCIVLLTQQDYFDVLALEPVDVLPEANALLEKGELAEAEILLKFAVDQSDDRDEVANLLEEITEQRQSLMYQGQQFGEGILLGRSEEPIGIVGSILADLTLYGDVRDLAIESYNALHPDREVDVVIVTLSAVGLSAGVVTIMNSGVSAPVKIGISILKAARQANRLPKWIVSLLRQRQVQDVKVVAEKIGVLAQQTNLHTAMSLTSKSRNSGELTQLGRLAESHGVVLMPLDRLVGMRRLIAVADQGPVAVQSAAKYGADGVRLLQRIGDVRWLAITSRVVKTIGYKQLWLRDWARLLQRIPRDFLYLSLVVCSLLWLPWEWIRRKKPS
ncbi:hypothetical protein U5801_00990 [Lamprobacter modestohalophilus]|uniref:hypothetical protein n=1 Tax=Lamprobacter modestohalophilus TaxID=1064514 RepID=UPI002ADED3A3|nr:hypothetical protein [Lamprobacter modestohalophilus]MEA1048399.1 hypothetical protein [Lamprobacter modestohalophilus]